MTSAICLSDMSYSGGRGGGNFGDTTAEDKDLSDIFDHTDNFKRSNKYSGRFLLI
jgi:hypothetical protein